MLNHANSVGGGSARCVLLRASVRDVEDGRGAFDIHGRHSPKEPGLAHRTPFQRGGVYAYPIRALLLLATSWTVAARMKAPAASRVGVALLALISFSTTARADIVTDWNTIAINTVSADTLNNRQVRDVAMVHAAMFDAMNAIRPYYTPAMVSIRAKGYASREAAAAH